MDSDFTVVTPPPDVEDEDGQTFAEYQVSPAFMKKLPPGAKLAKIKKDLYERWVAIDPVGARAELMGGRYGDDIVGDDAVWGDMRYVVIYQSNGLLRIGWNRYMTSYTKAKFQKIIDAALYVLKEAAFPRRTARQGLSEVARRKGLPSDLTMDVMKKFLGGRRRKTNRKSKKGRRSTRK